MLKLGKQELMKSKGTHILVYSKNGVRVNQVNVTEKTNR